MELPWVSAESLILRVFQGRETGLAQAGRCGGSLPTPGVGISGRLMESLRSGWF